MNKGKGNIPPRPLDAIDRRLLNLLQRDAKMPIQELANRLKLTKTPVYERIRRLETEGRIERYVALVNKRQVQAGILVFVTLRLEQQKIEFFNTLKTAITALPEVLEAYAVGGGTDFHLKVIVPDLDGYYEFASKKLASLPHIGNVNSTFVLSELKSTTAVTL
ncbi:AsnC family transcriptional regulator [Lewinellaceae bacterium SD302]|nr:AsnC family transcriptional regulator [Lewinellaceae bacterium SD302]